MRIPVRLGSEHRSRGQSVAEFAIAIPLFMLIVLGIAEGGYYVAATTIVASATHEGARLGVLEDTAAAAVVRARVKEAAQPLVSVSSGDVTLRIASIKEDGTFEALVSCDDTCYGQRKKDDRLVVTTNYSHSPLVGLVFPGVAFPSNARAELTVEGDAA